MLTPGFLFRQDEEKLYILIYVPNEVAEHSDYDLLGLDFIFKGVPYYLHLRLPGKVLSMDVSPGFRQFKSGRQEISFYKAVKGENFPCVDMPTMFIVRSRAGSLDSAGDSDTSKSDVPFEEMSNMTLNENEEEVFEQEQIEFTAPVTKVKARYGFGNRFWKVIIGFLDGTDELFYLEDPGRIPKSSNLRTAIEYADFKDQHYSPNFFYYEARAIMNYEAIWQKENFRSSDFITDAQFHRLRMIPKNIWNQDNRKFVFLGLVDILLAFCYDNRTTRGEPTTASASTISKLSSTFYWLLKFKSVDFVIKSFMKRSLSYPLYRNWYLSLEVVADVESLLRCDQLYIQKCLLEVRSLFDVCVEHRWLNTIYMDDYCHWIRHVDKNELKVIADEISKVKLRKEDVESYFDPFLEKAGQGVLDEHTANASTSVLAKFLTDLDSDNLSSEYSVQSGKVPEADDEDS